MNKHILTTARMMLCAVSCLCFSMVHADSLDNKLKGLAPVSQIEELESNDQIEKWVCRMEQQLDWNDEQAGKFLQRIIIKHKGFDKPTVMVTEGYDAKYAMRPNYKEELSTLLDANLIIVEHRFFAESTPKPCNWDFLTVENSAGDYHHIREVFKDIYPGKWFTTGISKGGQTTLFYRSYYPDDVDGSVAYVAPLNKSLEDGRHEPFLKNIHNKNAKQKIATCQRELLKRRATIQPMMEKFCKEKGYGFRTSMDEIYDLCVLELEFSFWQWGNDEREIPEVTADDSTFYKYLLSNSGPRYFSHTAANTPFNVQAMKELGYYGYDMKPLEDLLSIKRTEGYMRRVMIPDSLTYIEFDTNLYEHTKSFLKKADCPMIFIYGENDPWSASGVTWLKDKENMHVFVDPDGSHLARVGTMPKNIQKRIKRILSNWLK